MDLSPYLETVRHGVTSAAALGDDNTRQTAERLGGAVESSTRLALIRALSDAAAQISAETAPTSVELRMNGPDPELVVLVPAPTPEPTLLLPDDFTPYPGAAEPGAADADADSTLGEAGRQPTTTSRWLGSVCGYRRRSRRRWTRRPIVMASPPTPGCSGP